MGFNIRFVTVNRKYGRGEITLDQFSECFESPLHFWTVEDYRNQWINGINRIIGGKLKSAIVTAMYDPASANFIIWWIMYREQNLIVFQNQLLFMEQLKKPFDIAKIYNYIPDRLPSDDEEYPVSEWSIEIDKIKFFAKNERNI